MRWIRVFYSRKNYKESVSKKDASREKIKVIPENAVRRRVP